MSDNTFTRRTHREAITREPDPAGRWSAQFPEMIGYKGQGGGKVPADFGWKTNPKQWQEEMTEQRLEEHWRQRVLPRTPAGPALPEGQKAAEAPKPG